MTDKTDRQALINLLSSCGFSLKKGLGQNFLISEEIPEKIAQSCASENTGVIEIGPGAGILTRSLSKRAKRVVAFEVDRSLEAVLSKTLEGCDNVKIIYEDVLKADLDAVVKELSADCDDVVIAANLPYYITSPIIMSLLEKELAVSSVTVMVQKEAAQRLCAAVPSKNAGAVSVAVNYYTKPKILFEVDRSQFLPPPNVDSAVIRLDVLAQPPVAVADRDYFFKVVQAAFCYRRKTALNSISAYLNLDKPKVAAAIEKSGAGINCRAQELTLEQFASISKLLKEEQ